ncbi:MAG: DUF2891 domain-containing protein, partial [Burkholderiaceae bacterium]
YKLDQLLTAAADLRAPRDLHPLFSASYDWHSCVHMHWTLVRLLRRFPAHAQAAATRAHLDGHLTPGNVAGELATLKGPHRATFERPYGWGWLLALAAELEPLARDDAQARHWRDALAPLADAFAERFLDFLPRSDFPTRAGTHGNSAFALLLALDWSEATQHLRLRRAIVDRANTWFGRDRDYPALYEPGGDDFLAAGLVEAALMRRTVDGCSFEDWWQRFAPNRDAMAHWLVPVAVSDARDARIVHLHGVNLTRAWCWRLLFAELDPSLQPAVTSAIAAHLAASAPAATGGDYVGTHWLASFLVLALDDA